MTGINTFRQERFPFRNSSFYLNVTARCWRNTFLIPSIPARGERRNTLLRRVWHHVQIHELLNETHGDDPHEPGEAQAASGGATKETGK